MAAGCLPVLLQDSSDPFEVGAFAGAVNYSSFRVAMASAAFVRDPRQLVRALRRMPAGEVAARQRALAAHRADLLYDDALRELGGGRSRVGDHFLAEAARCLVQAEGGRRAGR